MKRTITTIVSVVACLLAVQICPACAETRAAAALNVPEVSAAAAETAAARAPRKTRIGPEPRAVPPLTRATFASMLYRLCGSPEVVEAEEFEDVPTDASQNPAVVWAVQNEYLSPVATDTFGAEKAVTRLEGIRAVWRIAGSPRGQWETSIKDAAGLPGDMRTAVQWADQAGLLDDLALDNGNLRPGLAMRPLQTARMLISACREPGSIADAGYREDAKDSASAPVDGEQ